MDAITLTIAIPTFNRVHLLRQTVELLLPQLKEGVELLVCDNASTDGTSDYLTTLRSRLRHQRHATNIGSDANFLFCITVSKGKYTWILCDDDLPCSNAVEQILQAREVSGEPGLIYLRAKSSDQRVSDYTPAPVQTKWITMNRDDFLEDIGVWVTFGSSVVVRTDCIDTGFIRQQFGTSLVPASLPLQAAGTTNSVVVSEQPVLFVRGGNAGGYDAYTVFSKNFRRLLSRCRPFGYSQKALDTAYESALQELVPYLVDVWPLTALGTFNLALNSWKQPVFYRQVVPSLWHKWVKAVRAWPFGLCWKLTKLAVRGFTSRFGAEFYAFAQEQVDRAALKNFKGAVFEAGPNASVRHPIYLKNPKYFQIGENFRAEPGLRIEAWDSFAGERFRPLVRIGNNVSLNWNVHVGAIDRIDIHDNVLIGSNVLITDHSHGRMNATECDQAPGLRPLASKGPVVIEENVWIGENVSILPNVTIGRGAIIGANSVVNKSVPAYTVVGGAPARVLKNLR